MVYKTKSLDAEPEVLIDPNTLTLTTPTASAAATIPAASVVESESLVVEPSADTFVVLAQGQTEYVVEPSQQVWYVS